jgi:hypothetical protein
LVAGGLDVHALAGWMRRLSLVEESGQRRVLVFQRLDLNR